jgi:hypothetical protein
MIAKYKERKNNKPLLLFGEGIDAEGGARGLARTPWEGDILLNFDALVCWFPTGLVLTNIIKLCLTLRHRNMPLTTLSCN